MEVLLFEPADPCQHARTVQSLEEVAMKSLCVSAVLALMVAASTAAQTPSPAASSANSQTPVPTGQAQTSKVTPPTTSAALPGPINASGTNAAFVSAEA